MTKHERIKLLDHGFVELDDHMGNDWSIVKNARVTREPWRGIPDVDLIDFLMRNGHTTPFEVPEFNFYVKLPIFIVRQWHRHRTWSYNERSARYKPVPTEYHIPERKLIGMQSETNHQSRIIEDGIEDSRIADIRSEQLAKVMEHDRAAFELYNELLDTSKGAAWPRELARSVLPVSMYTIMFAKTDLHNLFHFLEERMAEGAQYEIRVYADAMFKIITEFVPVACEAFWVRRLKRSVEDYRMLYGSDIVIDAG